MNELFVPFQFSDFSFGLKVYFWVLNDEEDFESAIRLGVDGIMTDYPQKLIDFINRKHPELVRPAKKSLRNQVA